MLTQSISSLSFVCPSLRRRGAEGNGAGRGAWNSIDWMEVADYVLLLHLCDVAWGREQKKKGKKKKKKNKSRRVYPSIFVPAT